MFDAIQTMIQNKLDEQRELITTSLAKKISVTIYITTAISLFFLWYFKKK